MRPHHRHRAELEAGAEIPHLEKTVGADGVAQAATKKKPKQPEQDQPADIAAEIIPHQWLKLLEFEAVRTKPLTR